MGNRLVAEAIGTFWIVVRRLRERAVGGRRAAARHWRLRDRVRLRAERGDRGLRRGPYFRRSSQPCRLHRPHVE